MHPSRIMDAQREQMIALGLKHFETEDDWPTEPRWRTQ
jgi:hypothetical protein